MKGVLFVPQENPKVVEIDNTLQALQKIVGGYIETVASRVRRGVVLVCNEEGRFENLPPNGIIDGVGFVGNVIVLAVNGEEFDSLSENDVKWYLNYKRGQK